MQIWMVSALIALGIVNTKAIRLDGKFHRIFDPNGKPGNRDIAIAIHADCIILYHWREGWQKILTDKTSKPLTAQERIERQSRIDASNRDREITQRAEHKLAAEKAFKIWIGAKPASANHPYLIKKNIPQIGLRQQGAALLVPMHSIDGPINNIQFIYPDGTKRFLPGGRLKGLYHAIGNIADHLYVCEGMATAKSLHRMKGAAVAASMTCGNLQEVAYLLKRKYPHIEIIIAADDDRDTAENPGLTKAYAAAKNLGLKVIKPTWPQGTPQNLSDFNDLELWETSHG